MTVQKAEQVSKRVEFAAKDADAQVATGIVMVPDKVDLQNDFAREDTIRGFADQFEAFADAGEAGGGIMHAVFPDDWMALERNEVLDEAEDIGGTTAPAGAWVQSWRYNNDSLWSLVEDGILEGYSIGAIDVGWDGPFEQDEVDDVDTSEVPDDEAIWELVAGIIREVSTVDIPAVPDAQILSKDDAEKRLGDYLGNRSGFIDEAQERGHSEADAERLWDVLNAAVEAEGSAEPGKQSMFARAGKAFLSALSGSDDDTRSEALDGEKADGDDPECWVCGDEATYQNGDPPREYLCDEHAAPIGDRATELSATSKEGRTLSTQNRESLFATIDASLDVLQDAGVDHGMERFTDRSDTSFDLSEHSAREWVGDHGDDEDDDEETDVSPVNNATGSDTPDNSNSTTMSNDDNDNDAPEWAKSLQEQLDEQSKQIDEALTDEGDGDGEKDAFADAPEWAKALKEDVDAQAERIDNISKQTGATESQQLGGAEKNGSDGELSDRQKFFIPESRRA